MSAATKETPTEVKASGGIHTTEEAEAMINAGATKLGVSHSMQVIGKEQNNVENSSAVGENQPLNYFNVIID